MSCESHDFVNEVAELAGKERDLTQMDRKQKVCLLECLSEMLGVIDRMAWHAHTHDVDYRTYINGKEYADTFVLTDVNHVQLSGHKEFTACINDDDAIYLCIESAQFDDKESYIKIDDIKTISFDRA